MAIHLVRHADAGSRPEWNQPDDLRPLTNAGLVQAMSVADALRSHAIGAVLSSRYVRCMQTVQPLADTLSLRVETTPALAEEASLEQAWALLESAAGVDTDTVLCSHGNIISPMLDRLKRRGVDVVADEWSCHKGSIWSIEVDGGELTRAVQTLVRA